MIQYTNYIFDFENKNYKCRYFSVHKATFTKYDIAYRYWLLSPSKSDSHEPEIIKRKILYKDTSRDLYDPIVDRKTFLSGKAGKEGEVKFNCIWFREENDLKALTSFLNNIEKRKLLRSKNGIYYNLDDVFIDKLKYEIKLLTCNHKNDDGSEALIRVNDIVTCSICNAKFAEVK